MAERYPEGGETRIEGECCASGGEGEGANGLGQLIKGRQLLNGEWLQKESRACSTAYGVGLV